PCRIVAASPRRVVAIVPEGPTGESSVCLSSGQYQSNAVSILVGTALAEEMHIVANPAVDPADEAIVFTRSGPRGQRLPATIYRLEADGYLDELPVEVMNPTGIAFGPGGRMFVTNRAEGKVLVVENSTETETHASGLGIATGIAFDDDGVMYVGDRSGTIYRIEDGGRAEMFAALEPSVAAYHLAFGPDKRLYVSAPGLASHDSIFAIDSFGEVETFFRGFGRPQGLAFDQQGNLYIAACYRGRHGLVRVSLDGASAEIFAAAANLVGLCFTGTGDLILATNDSIYSIPAGVKGTLLEKKAVEN
ncbi:MAG: gluconolaconase, partial [Pyrinomonadaceae bacterium]